MRPILTLFAKRETGFDTGSAHPPTDPVLALAAALLVAAPLVPAPALHASPARAAATAFVDCPTGTGLSATVLIPSEAAIALPAGSLAPGDQIAVVDGAGTCVGAAVWTGTGVALSVWADDPFTEGVEGLVPGAPLAFRVWTAGSGTTVEPTVVYADGFGAQNGFSVDGLYVVAEAAPVSADAPADGPALDALAQSRPNPTRGRTEIAFTLARPGAVALEVYDALGRLVATPLDAERAAGDHTVAFDASGLAAGMYVYRLRAGDEVLQKRLTVAR